MTGKPNQCWACGEDVQAEEAMFNQNVAPRIPETSGDAKQTTKVCLFCSAECWDKGWPLVRHHYIMVATASAPK